MSLQGIAERRERGGREFLLAPMASLRAWAAAQGLSLRQAQELALEAGIFPEALERNFPSLTPAEQLTLWRGSALVAGLGGLGREPGLAQARRLCHWPCQPAEEGATVAQIGEVGTAHHFL
jgi:hypothetical protein